MKNCLAPSILAADWGKLNEEVVKIESEADLLHFDVMDGHYVPFIQVGLNHLKVQTRLPKWVHLMTESPEKYADDFINAGANWISFHADACEDVVNLICQIRNKGVRVGLVLSPEREVNEIKEYLNEVDHVMVMTVRPGRGGQEMMPEMLEKVKQLRSLRSDLDIAVDGGVNLQTIGLASAAGANVFVTGAAVFRASDPVQACRDLKKQAIMHA